MKHRILSACVGLLLLTGAYAQPSIRSVADAMSRLPEMPTAEQLSDEQAREQYTSSTFTPFSQAVEQSLLQANSESATIAARMQSAGNRQTQRSQASMQQYSRNVEAGLMPSQQEMVQILMSSGIDLNKATEQQVMDAVAGSISQKWGVSKDEYLKIIAMAQSNPKQAEAYMKSNHPDLYNRLYAVNGNTDLPEGADERHNERFGEIGVELAGLLEQLNNTVSTYRPIEQSSWADSDEAREVDAIEQALDERLAQWAAGLKAVSGEVPYPSWWTDGRKKENVLIDQWNRREAQRRLDAASAYRNELKGMFDKVAALETENEQLGRDSQDNSLYLMNKLNLLTFRNFLQHILVPYHDVLESTGQTHLDETGALLQGKG